jgi:hypothetical protein
MADKPQSYERLYLPGVHSEDLVTRHHVPVVHEISSGLAAKASNLSNTTLCVLQILQGTEDSLGSEYGGNGLSQMLQPSQVPF